MLLSHCAAGENGSPKFKNFRHFLEIPGWGDSATELTERARKTTIVQFNAEHR